MMNKVLVTYTTMSGSTAEVAGVIGEEIAGKGMQVDVLPLEKVTRLDEYGAVVLGAPMIMGWHRSALKFLRSHQDELEQLPVAIFAMAMSLTSYGKTDVDGVPVFIDENLPVSPKNSSRLTIRERYANVDHYAAPILKAARSSQPVSVAFFGGKLDYYRLKPLAMLFVMLVVRANPGDRRNWPAIRYWAGSLPSFFNSQNVGN